MADEMGRNFEDVQTRLSQIVDEVSSEDISLDDALKLYEEAVKLGLSACDLSEQDIDAYLGAAEPTADGAAEGAAEAGTADADADAAEGTAPVGASFSSPAATEEESPAPAASTDENASA